jgi:nucleoside-diphosphate-sugar epimerase
VHAAFDHLPGRFRGGAGDDPEGFRARNVEGSRRLLAAAAEARIPRVLALSSRAVHGDHRSGPLAEDDALAPDTLYGAVKRDLEAMLPAYPGIALALRPTGVFGLVPGTGTHKWRGLFADFLRGEPVAPRVATEVHGADLAAAALLLLDAPSVALAHRAYAVSDLVLDRHDLLAALAAAAGSARSPPPRADAAVLGVMVTDRLRALGWRPAGRARLGADMPAMAALARSDAGDLC